MIKKSIFEDEIISGMQRKLAEAEVEQGMGSVEKAVDYLNSAMSIFEDAGMYSKADQILSILVRIAQSKGSEKIRKMLNEVLHPVKEIKDEPEEEEISYESLLKPEKDLEEEPKGEFINMTSVAKAKFNPKRKLSKDPKRLDRHTKGLTPEKMVKNLLHHGTEFNLSDDGNIDLLNADLDEESDFRKKDFSSFEDE